MASFMASTLHSPSGFDLIFSLKSVYGFLRFMPKKYGNLQQWERKKEYVMGCSGETEELGLHICEFFDEISSLFVGYFSFFSCTTRIWVMPSPDKLYYRVLSYALSFNPISYCDQE